jgi:hypothetical protein
MEVQGVPVTTMVVVAEEQGATRATEVSVATPPAAVTLTAVVFTEAMVVAVAVAVEQLKLIVATILDMVAALAEELVSGVKQPMVLVG